MNTPNQPLRSITHCSKTDQQQEPTTDTHLRSLQSLHCDCPDCHERIFYLDPEGRWWCFKHSKQAIFVAIGVEYDYPEIIFTNTALTQFAGIEGRAQWYAFARACRIRPAALEHAIFEALAQLKLRTHINCACRFLPATCSNAVGAPNGLCVLCASGNHTGHITRAEEN